MAENVDKPISAFPTKSFFVDMLIRDIPLQQAVLDLIDNCVDGAKRLREKEDEGEDFTGLKVEISLSKEGFTIVDNCGGFTRSTAQQYAFRFGRPKEFDATKHSIGQFGVGMKRALFKFGRKFVVESKTCSENWAVEVNVDEWQNDDDDWTFPWTETKHDRLGNRKTGTHISVTDLREGTAATFGTQNFENKLISAIKTKHREFISEGLEIFVNKNRVNASQLQIYSNYNLKPVVETFEILEGGGAPVDVRIVVGIGESNPRLAGWYVVCNGRVILDADRRPQTGWGYIERHADQPFLPSFHNQYSRFRGIVYFDSEDSARVPWNTMKTDVDEDSIVWQKTFERMVLLARDVLDFINKLDLEIADYGRDKSPLIKLLKNSQMESADRLTKAQPFEAPERSSIEEAPPRIIIQYSKPEEDVAFLREALGLNSAKAVGEKTFDFVLERQKG